MHYLKLKIKLKDVKPIGLIYKNILKIKPTKFVWINLDNQKYKSECQTDFGLYLKYKKLLWHVLDCNTTDFLL